MDVVAKRQANAADHLIGRGDGKVRLRRLLHDETDPAVCVGQGVRIRKRIAHIPRDVAIACVPLQGQRIIDAIAPDLPFADVDPHASPPPSRLPAVNYASDCCQAILDLTEQRCRVLAQPAFFDVVLEWQIL